MKMIIEQVKNNIKENKKTTTLIFLLFIISITLMITSISYYNSFLNRKIEFSKLYNRNYYQLHDNYFGEDETIFLEEKDNLSRLKSFYSDITSMENITYYNLNSQPIYLKDANVANSFYYGFEESGEKQIVDINQENQNYHYLKSAQISDNVITDFNLKITSNISDKDIIKQWKNTQVNDTNIPIILGYNYRNIMELGDIYKIYTMLGYFNVEVIGFLEKDSNIYCNSDMLYLDNYILIPSFEINNIPENENEKAEQLRYYLQKVNGVISSTYSANEVQLQINKIASKYQLKDFRIQEADTSNLKIFNMQAEDFSKMLLIISFIIVIFSAIGLSLNLTTRIEKNLNTYAIHLLVGADIKIIKKYIIYEILFIIITSIIISIIISEIINKFVIYNLGTSIIISLIIGICSAIYPLTMINKVSLNSILKRSE